MTSMVEDRVLLAGSQRLADPTFDLLVRAGGDPPHSLAAGPTVDQGAARTGHDLALHASTRAIAGSGTSSLALHHPASDRQISIERTCIDIMPFLTSLCSLRRLERLSRRSLSLTSRIDGRVSLPSVRLHVHSGDVARSDRSFRVPFLQQLVASISPDNYSINIGVLQTAHSIFKRFVLRAPLLDLHLLY